MKTIRTYLAACTLAGVVTVPPVLTTSPGDATPVTPRAVAMADNSLPLAYGIEALTENPAALGRESKRTWELRLFSLSTEVRSNALGMGDYATYNGATLSAEDKTEILNKIPSEGWRLGAHAEASAAAVRVGAFGARVSGFGTARGTIDKEILEILFHGNQKDRLYTSDFNSGEALAAAELSLSFGARVAHVHEYPLYAGLTVRLIRGLYYAELEHAAGDLVAEMSGASGNGEATATTAEGGNGIGLNWGTTLTLGPRYTLALVLENAPAIIRWTDNVQTRRYGILFEGITADNFEDSLWIDEETSTPLNSFTRSLPTRLRLGVGRAGEKLRTTAVLTFGFADRLTTSTTPEVGLGAEYLPIGFLPLRAGFTVGGADRFTAGIGGGLFLGWFRLELGVRTAGGLWPTRGRGATVAMAGGLHF